MTNFEIISYIKEHIAENYRFQVVDNATFGKIKFEIDGYLKSLKNKAVIYDFMSLSETKIYHDTGCVAKVCLKQSINESFQIFPIKFESVT